MASATRVYIIMLLIFGLGLWTILSFGGVYLKAPTDISGQWNLYTLGQSSESEPAHKLSIDQSGWYCRVIIDGNRNKVFDLKQRSPGKPARNINDPIDETFGGTGLQMTFSGQSSQQLSLNLTGALDGTWNAVLSDPKRPVGAGAKTRPTASNAGH